MLGVKVAHDTYSENHVILSNFNTHQQHFTDPIGPIEMEDI